MGRFCALVIVAAAMLSPALAGGETQFLVDGTTWVIGTGTGSGICTVTTQAGYAEITCIDGDNWAVANTRDGCVGIRNKGACGKHYITAAGSMDVNCTGGNTFTISTGTDEGSGNTTKDGNGRITGGQIQDKVGNSAGVDCTTNGGRGSCTGITGSGTCGCKSPCSN